MTDPGVRVRPARTDDIPVIKQIAEAHKPMLGFVSCSALNTALRQGKRLVALPDHCGCQATSAAS